jgi:RNA polymerase primary sigma factor
VTTPSDSDRELLIAALQGDAAAAVALTHAIADLVWTACGRVTQSREETESVFRDVLSALRADRFARLKGYDGRARVRVYVAPIVRDLLSERVVKLIALAAGRG